MAGTGFVVLYRWRLKPGLEQSFVDGWYAVAEHFPEVILEVAADYWV
jgi:hypothetical protein